MNSPHNTSQSGAGTSFSWSAYQNAHLSVVSGARGCDTTPRVVFITKKCLIHAEKPRASYNVEWYLVHVKNAHGKACLNDI